MKTQINQNSNKRRRTQVWWAAALGLGLTMTQAPAASTNPLSADEAALLAAAPAQLGYTAPQRCQMTALDSLKKPQTSNQFFKLACPGISWLLKYGEPPDADRISASFVALLKENMPAEQFARIRQPVGVFSFDKAGKGKGKGKGHYTAYPWVEGTSLHDWRSKLSPSGDQDLKSEQMDTAQLERLQKVYRQIGTLIGAVQRAGVMAEAQKKTLPPTHPKQQNFSIFNLLVTPEDEILANLDNVVLITGEELLKGEGIPMEAVLDPESLLDDSHPWMSFVMLMIVSDGLLESYCEALGDLKLGPDGKQAAACSHPVETQQDSISEMRDFSLHMDAIMRQLPQEDAVSPSAEQTGKTEADIPDRTNEKDGDSSGAVGNDSSRQGFRQGTTRALVTQRSVIEQVAPGALRPGGQCLLFSVHDSLFPMGRM